MRECGLVLTWYVALNGRLLLPVYVMHTLPFGWADGLLGDDCNFNLFEHATVVKHTVGSGC